MADGPGGRRPAAGGGHSPGLDETHGFPLNFPKLILEMVFAETSIPAQVG